MNLAIRSAALTPPHPQIAAWLLLVHCALTLSITVLIILTTAQPRMGTLVAGGLVCMWLAQSAAEAPVATAVAIALVLAAYHNASKEHRDALLAAEDVPLALRHGAGIYVSAATAALEQATATDAGPTLFSRALKSAREAGACISDRAAELCARVTASAHALAPEAVSNWCAATLRGSSVAAKHAHRPSHGNARAPRAPAAKGPALPPTEQQPATSTHAPAPAPAPAHVATPATATAPAPAPALVPAESAASCVTKAAEGAAEGTAGTVLGGESPKEGWQRVTPPPATCG